MAAIFNALSVFISFFLTEEEKLPGRREDAIFAIFKRRGKISEKKLDSKQGSMVLISPELVNVCKFKPDLQC
jgi:hypothetical protein